MTVTQPQYENILYIKSSESIGHQLVIQHLTHEQRSQMSMKQYIDQLAYQFQRDVRTQQKTCERDVESTSNDPDIFEQITDTLSTSITTRSHSILY